MKALVFIGCVALPLIVGGLSGVATARGLGEWYANVTKPSFNPPNYVFGPVWTLLYTLMGVSLFLTVYSAKGQARNLAITLFAIQLTLNFFWSFLFFYFNTMGWALIEIIVLWCSIVAMIYFMYQLRPLAGLLQVPYLLWVSFATVLNASFWWLNK